MSWLFNVGVETLIRFSLVLIWDRPKSAVIRLTGLWGQMGNGNEERRMENSEFGIREAQMSTSAGWYRVSTF